MDADWKFGELKKVLLLGDGIILGIEVANEVAETFEWRGPKAKEFVAGSCQWGIVSHPKDVTKAMIANTERNEHLNRRVVLVLGFNMNWTVPCWNRWPIYQI